jgi:trehalose 6-phosphate phosphatase
MFMQRHCRRSIQMMTGPMTLLFSEEGRDRFNAIVEPGILCAFDFDGTLSAIVPQPERATLAPELKQLLLELSEHAPVAIITGRSVADLRARLGFDTDFIIGNHGLEGTPGWETRGEHYENLCAGWRDQLSAALRAQGFPESQIWIENKRYSLSLHYRLADDRDALGARLARLFDTLAPAPRVVAGKYIYNLLPEEVIHKGSALEQLMRVTGASSAIYVGDDVTDEDVFRLRRADLLSVRVEPEAESAAPYFLEKRQDVAQLLHALIERLRDQKAENWTRRRNASNASIV